MRAGDLLSPHWPVVAARALVVLVLAAVGYVVFIPQTGVDDARMSQLVIDTTGLPTYHAEPAGAKVIAPAKSTLPVVKASALAHPDETAVYERTWASVAGKTSAIVLLVHLLPTTELAAGAEKQAVQQYTGPDSQTKGTGVYDNAVTVPGVPGAVGSQYSQAASSASPASQSDFVVFGYQRVVVIEYLQGPPSPANDKDAVAVAQRQYAWLPHAEPGFSLESTTWPVTASVLYWAVALVLAAAAAFVPVIVRRVRHVRAVRAHERYRQQYRGRGGKTLKRQRKPVGGGRR